MVLASLALSSCNVNKYLAKDEFLVKSVKFEFDDKKNSKNTPGLDYNLQSFVLQKPNSNYLLIYPRELIYFQNKELIESSEKLKGFVSHSEKPSIFNQRLMLESAKKMENYLRYSRGYYYAKVSPQVYKSDKRAKIVYHITTDQQYKMHSKEYLGEDKRILAKLRYYDNKSVLQPGVSIDEKNFDAEKTRIVNLLQEIGYANFSKNHIEFAADTTGLTDEMNVFVYIHSPANDSIHRTYTIGKINVITDYKAEKDTASMNHFDYNNKTYYYDDIMHVRTQTLERMFSFKHKDLFDKNNINNTYSALVQLGTYRFVNISPTPSAEYDTVIDYQIYLTPFDKTWSVGGSLFEMYFSKSNNSLIGLSSSPTISNINLFGGGERYSLGLEGAIEFNLNRNTTRLLQTYGFNIDNSLKYPTLLDKFFGQRLYRLFSKDEDHFIRVNNRSLTEMNLSYNINRQIDQFVLNSVRASYGYSTKANPRYSWFFTPISMTYINNNANKDWLEEVNIFLRRTFELQYFLTSVVFNELNLVVQTPTFSTGFTYNANLTLEQSGSEIWAINSIFDRKTEWTLLDSTQLTKYVKLDMDLTSKQKLGTKHALAGRFRIGTIFPFANTYVPFQKQLYVGGANSIRAFAIRQLGPGGTSEILADPKSKAPFVQTGEMALEASIEYRFPLFYYFEGAAFIDAGNMWALDKKNPNPEALFRWNQFYKQIAVGYGLGLRLDLDFLLFRLDAGYVARLPYQDEATKSYWVRPEFTAKYLFGANLNFAINYPF